MREILFRGKTTDGRWVEGGYCCVPDEGATSRGKRHYIVVAHISDVGNEPFPRRVDPETVGQYTGRTTEHGVKIFEGDIVYSKGKFDSFDTPSGVVTMDSGCWAIVGDNGHLLEDSSTEVLCILGNIHDNPELLED